MSTDTPLTDALRQVVGAEALEYVRGWRQPYDPTADLDEATLRRGRGLSASARREQRRPKPFAVDELGYTPTGTWSGGDAA